MKIENLRFYIQVRVKLGIDCQTIFKELKTAISDHAPSLRTVQRWFKHFKGGNEVLKDKPRSGRPITGITKENIRRVNDVIEDDPWCSYDEIEAETSLSRGTIFNIIHDHLKLKKVTSRWVPYDLTEENRQERVRICQENLAKFKDGRWRLCDVVTGDESWFYHRQIGRKQSNASWVKEGESPRTVVRQNRFEPKTMFSIFFKTNGVVHISYLERGMTIDHKSYLDDCLKPLVKALNKQRPISSTKNVKFHHDNARAHIHSQVKTYLESENFIIMEHPPYSPDLAPSDFWLFDYIKQRLSDATDAKSLNTQITRIVKCITEKEFQKTFNKWIERMELCIKYQGHYFEHLSK